MRSARRRGTSRTASSTRSARAAAWSGSTSASMFLREDGDYDAGDAARGHRPSHRLHRSAHRDRPRRLRLGLRRRRDSRRARRRSRGCRGSSPRCVPRPRRRRAREDHARELAARASASPGKPWSRYFRLAGFEARPTLIEAAGRFAAPGLAVDLGAGTGRDTLELLRRGWKVDRDRRASRRRSTGSPSSPGRTPTASKGGVGRFEDATWPACDLLNASFSLPFTPPDAFPALWQRIVDSIVPGGRFSGQFFGDRDEWARTGLVVQTRARGRSAAGAVRDRELRGVRAGRADGGRQDEAVAPLPRGRAEALAYGLCASGRSFRG